MKGLVEALDKKGVAINISEEAKRYLALTGFTSKYGARQISGVIRNQLRRPISKYIIAGDLNKMNTVNINLEGESLQWNIV